MSESVKVRDIVTAPGLHTAVLSGESGLDRPVLWAHSCELENPGEWLQPHELLMTVGMCIPEGAQAQRLFIQGLADAGLAGIAIGDHGIAPTLTEGLFEESRERSFPVLQTAPETPFVALSRFVATFDDGAQSMGVLRLAKLYNVAARRSLAERRSGASLSALFGTPITVLDQDTGCVVIGSSRGADHDERRRPLRTVHPTALYMGSGATLDSLSLVHLSQVLEVDANEILQLASDRVRESRQVLTAVLAGDTPAARAAETWLGPDDEGYRVVVTDSAAERRVELRLALEEFPALVGTTVHGQVVVVPAGELELLRAVLEELGLTAGVSGVHRDLGDVSGGVAEAAPEFRVARDAGEPWRVYAGERVSLLGRSRSERRRIVEDVLGPLTGEGQKAVALRETLFTFLDHDQQWNETAKALGLHRQTVTYRLRRVEDLTHRSIRRTAHLTEFWLARSSWDQYAAER